MQFLQPHFRLSQFILGVILFSTYVFGETSSDLEPQSGLPPRLLTWDGAALYELRKKLSQGNATLPISVSTALEHIRQISESWHLRMSQDLLPLVTNKTVWPEEATQNHYVSYVPYAHPCTELPDNCIGYNGAPVDNSDCDSKTKLPWRICDDRLNIRARDLYTDRPRLEEMMHAVMRLSLTAYLFRNKSHANAAVQLLDKWFVSNQTRMLPTLRYAQGVPGVVDGKPSGCIDLSLFGRGFADAVTLLMQSPETAWPVENVFKFREWCTSLLDEMLNHPRIRSESRMRNNHGLYYDLTVLSLSALSNASPRPAQITRMLNGTCDGYIFCVRGRLEDQADKNGVQVHESMRPGYGHYVWYTLLAHVHLYSMAQSQGFQYPVESSAMMRIVGWTTRNWNKVTGSAEEWQIYGVQAYQLIARMQSQAKFDAEMCEMLHQMWRRFKARGVWHENRVGMDVWNLVYATEQTNECSVWNYFPRLQGSVDMPKLRLGSEHVVGTTSRTYREIIGFNIESKLLYETSAKSQWMSVFAVCTWSVVTAFFVVLRSTTSTKKILFRRRKHVLSTIPSLTSSTLSMKRCMRQVP